MDEDKVERDETPAQFLQRFRRNPNPTWLDEARAELLMDELGYDPEQCLVTA